MGKMFSGIEAIKDNGDTIEEKTSCCCRHHHLSGQTHCGAGNETTQISPVFSEQVGNISDGGYGSSYTTLDICIDKAGAAFMHAMDDFAAVGHYLVIGAFIAALAQNYIDRSSFLSLTAVPALSVVLMMTMAILLNLLWSAGDMWHSFDLNSACFCLWRTLSPWALCLRR